MKHPASIETQRLWLKGMNPAWIHDLFSNQTKSFIMNYLGVDEASYQHYLEMHEKGMETHRHSLFCFLLVKKEDGVPIGECGFHTWNQKHRRAEVFYLLRNDEYKKHGFMTEALPQVLNFGFNELKLHRVEALIDANNLPSLALLKKCGFTFEGTMREDYDVDGKNEDSDCYSLLKQEWKP